MSKIVQLKATSRSRAGKGASRAVRREGLVPGVVYGDKKEAQLISLSYRDLEPAIQTGRFLSTLVDLDVEGKVVRAIARDIQFEPVRDFIIHVDFLRLGKDAKIAVEVPVVFKGQDVCAGVKAGGTLNIAAHEVELMCSADFIPDQITVDVSGLQINHSIHLSNIELPKGVTSAAHDDVTLVAVTTKKHEVETTEAPVTAEVPATAQKAPAAAAAPAAGAKGAAAPAKGAAPAAAPAAPKKK
jgi:large subunit ribosomal protein L25